MPVDPRTLIAAAALLASVPAGCVEPEPPPAEEIPAPPSEEAAEEDEMFFAKAARVEPALGPYSRLREAAVAGSWYSSDPTSLADELDGYLSAAGASPTCGGDLPLALVSPHAGYRYSGPTAAVAYAQVQGCTVRRVWALAPTHRLGIDGVGLYDVESFRTPLGDLPVDQAVVERLAARDGFSVLRRGDGGEHSLEIQLPLLQRALGSFELVPLLVGRVGAEEAEDLAAAIRPELGPGDLVVISTDFTHHGRRFGYDPLGLGEGLPERLHDLDHGAWAHLEEPDPAALHAYMVKTGATICGRNPLKILAALVPAGTRGTELAYTTSGEITGDWSNSVSYLAGRLDGPSWNGTGPGSGSARFVDRETAAWLLGLAERSLHHYYEHKTRLEVDPAEVPTGAKQTLGAFVTLEKGGKLRGCIGEIAPYRPAWEAVAERAVDAAIKDSRFPPVTADELPHLELDVTLLGPSWRVPDASGFIVGRHGVVVSKGARRATFLPQVAPDQGWDRETALRRLVRKAGIPGEGLDDVEIQVYEAQVIHEQP